ncbi:MAG TPA: AI-2E family transporter [Rhodanobacteraceae bacterium]|nr:AI-2E family transporter [Rhodanobacteraceae bacterium]
MQGEPAVPPPMGATIADVNTPVATASVLLRPLRLRPRRPGALERRRARRLRAVRIPLLVLMFLAVATTLVVARSLFVPLVLAAFVGMGLNPIVAGLNRVYVPRVLGALLVMTALMAGLVEAAVLLTAPAVEWTRQAPQAIHQLAPKLRHMLRPLSAASHAASQSLVGMGVGTSGASSANTSPSFGLSDLLLLAPPILAEALTVLLLVFFFLTYGDHMRRRLASASPRFAYRRIALNLVRGIQHEISHYLLTVTLINGCLGALTTAILWGWQMPDPVLWGCVVALLNYMPYLGAITSTLLLCVVGLLHFNEPAHALLPALCFAGLAALEGNVITPMIMGHRLRLSPLAILIWLLIWGWMWGIPGALLAVPMLTCAKLITERVPGMEWFARMVQR